MYSQETNRFFFFFIISKERREGCLKLLKLNTTTPIKTITKISLYELPIEIRLIRSKKLFSKKIKIISYRKDVNRFSTMNKFTVFS